MMSCHAKEKLEMIYAAPSELFFYFILFCNVEILFTIKNVR